MSAALGRPCQPGPNPGGLRRIRSGPVSGGGLTRRGRPGARRASPRTGPLPSGQRRLGRNREAWLGPRAEAPSGWWDASPERFAWVPAAGDQGSWAPWILGAVCQSPGAWGGGNSRVPPAWSPAGTRRLRQVSNLRPGMADSLGVQQGKAFPGRWVNPKTSLKAKRTESHQVPPTLILFGMEVSFKIPNNTLIIWRTF